MEVLMSDDFTSFADFLLVKRNCRVVLAQISFHKLPNITKKDF